MAACFCTCSVPHPFAFFQAKGWETANPKVRNYAVEDLGAQEWQAAQDLLATAIWEGFVSGHDLSRTEIAVKRTWALAPEGMWIRGMEAR